MRASIIILLYGSILLLPSCSSIRCLCTCIRNDGQEVLSAYIVREPPLSECVDNSECNQPCQSAFSLPMCTLQGACDRRSTTTALVPLTTSKTSTPGATVSSIFIDPSKWGGTYSVDVKICDSTQCCCPTGEISIKRTMADDPNYFSIRMSLSGSAPICGLVTNVNEDNVRPYIASTLYVPLQSGILLINMDEINNNRINITYWNGLQTCQASALRLSASSGSVNDKQLLYVFSILGLVLINILL